MTEPTAPKGRPRPDATKQRDNVVLEYLKGQKNDDETFAAKTRDEIAEATSLPGNQVYLCLYRLSRTEPALVERGAGHRWSPTQAGVEYVVEAPAEVPAEESVESVS